jgi:hypothetical protein
VNSILSFGKRQTRILNESRRSSAAGSGEDFAVVAEGDIPADGEEEAFAVRGPDRCSGAAFGVCYQPDLCAVGVHYENLIARVSVRRERDSFAVGRPGRPAVKGRVVGDVVYVGAVGVRYEDFRIHLADHAPKRELFPIG